MTWFRVDDNLSDHPKIFLLQARKGWEKALALWVIAGSWSAKQVTDGAIPRDMPSRFGCSPRAADMLVSVGLWDVTDAGWSFHGWAERNPTRSSVEARRSETRDRVARWRGNAVTDGVRNAVTDGVRNAVTDGVRNALGTLLPSPPIPSHPEQIQRVNSEARASTPPPRVNDPGRVELPDAPHRSSRPGGDLSAWAEVETAIQAAYDGTGITPPLALSAAQKAAACDHARQVARTHGVDLYEAAKAIGEVSSRAPSAKERVFALSQEDPWAARAAKRDPEMAHLARWPSEVPESVSVIEHVRRLAAAQ